MRTLVFAGGSGRRVVQMRASDTPLISRFPRNVSLFFEENSLIEYWFQTGGNLWRSAGNVRRHRVRLGKSGPH